MLSNTLPKTITIIAAVARDGAIGKGGDLLYHFPEDLRRFKGLTMGHPIIMGRKTFESMPNGALPGRRNIVVTRNPDYRAEGAETAPSLERALLMAGAQSTPFIIGGGEIYAEGMKYASRMELTLVKEDGPHGADTFFSKFKEEDWEEINRTPLFKDEKTGVHFIFATYSRKKRIFVPD